MRIPAACLAVLLCAACASPALADENEETGISIDEHVTGASFIPLNLGRFVFRKGGGDAYTPIVAAVLGGSLAYQIVMERYTLGLRLTYLHTLTRYDDRFPDLEDELAGYADLLRPSVTAGLSWSVLNDKVVIGLTLLLGPSFVWFEDARMAGLHVGYAIPLDFRIGDHFRIFFALGSFVDVLFAVEASGWAEDDVGHSRANTVFFNAEVGVKLAF